MELNIYSIFLIIFLNFLSIGTTLLAADQDFLFDDYAGILEKFVNNKGLVDYKALQAGRDKLDNFVSALGKVEPETYGKWTEEEKIAFWLNAYNALTLQAIINNYPIKSSVLKSAIYPKNSIRQIRGVWDKLKFKVMGKKISLGHIEHEILRKDFKEPRIHMAMVCAAMGCPPLLNKPYNGQELDSQLDNRGSMFFSDKDKFRIDREKRKVYLSSILKWFSKDFVEKFGAKQNVPGLNKNESAVIRFAGKYIEKSDADFLLAGNFKIKYLNYDWSLNEQK